MQEKLLLLSSGRAAETVQQVSPRTFATTSRNPDRQHQARFTVTAGHYYYYCTSKLLLTAHEVGRMASLTRLTQRIKENFQVCKAFGRITRLMPAGIHARSWDSEWSGIVFVRRIL